MGKGLRQTLGYKEFRKYNVLFPSLPEQKAIADFLDKKCSEIDEMIALQEKIVEELKAYKQSVITEVVTKGLNPDVPMKDSGIEWIGEIPEHWRIVRNKNVFSNSKILVGDAWNTTQLLSLTTKGIKAVAIGSTSGKVPDSYDSYQVVEKDNIVMCLFDLDCSAVFSGLSPIHGMISPAYKALTIKNGFLPDFYAKWFDYIFDGRKFMFLSKNIRYSLTYDEFASLQVVAPPLLEQQKIASFLDRKCTEIDNLISIKLSKIDSLKEYKKSIIYEYVTGKKEVTE